MCSPFLGMSPSPQIDLFQLTGFLSKSNPMVPFWKKDCVNHALVFLYFLTEYGHYSLMRQIVQFLPRKFTPSFYNEEAFSLFF